MSDGQDTCQPDSNYIARELYMHDSISNPSLTLKNELLQRNLMVRE